MTGVQTCALPIYNRNQHDLIRSMPGGVAGVRQMIADFHRRGVRVLFPTFAFHYGLPVDSAGALTDGRAFQDIREFKRLLLDREEQTVARNLVSQLATYATGAPIGFSDRKQVQEVLDKTRGSGYGVRDMVHGIVASELFRNK